MTTVTFFEKCGRYTGFTASGHSMFAKNGKDIVCASISVLVINTINAITELNKEECDIKTDEDKGIISFTLKSSKEESTQTLIKALELGLNGIMDEYGRSYVKVLKTDKEVN